MVTNKKDLLKLFCVSSCNLQRSKHKFCKHCGKYKDFKAGVKKMNKSSKRVSFYAGGIVYMKGTSEEVIPAGALVVNSVEHNQQYTKTLTPKPNIKPPGRNTKRKK